MTDPVSDFTFSPPAATAGFVKADHENHLLAFVTPRLEPKVSTSFGDSDAAHVDTVVCLDCPSVDTDQLLFGDALVPRLCGGFEAEIVLGRLVRGNAKPGRSAPWLLEEAAPEDEQHAGEFFAKHATRLKSGVIVVELEDDPVL
jgi:hypothetical protein